MAGQENGARGRADDGTGRTYLGPDGTRWPSMTTLTGLLPGKAEGLARWRAAVGDEAADEVMNEAIDRGNRIHDGIEAYLKRAWILQDGSEATDAETACPDLVRRWLTLHVADVTAVERTVANRTERYAGTADVYGILNGNAFATEGTPFALDWKSGKRRPDHAVQVLGYADADLALEGEDWVPFGEGWSWDTVTVYAEGRDGSHLALTQTHRPRHVVALVGYIGRDDSLDVREVKPSAYDALRSIRRGLRGAWEWNALSKRGLLAPWPGKGGRA